MTRLDMTGAPADFPQLFADTSYPPIIRVKFVGRNCLGVENWHASADNPRRRRWDDNIGAVFEADSPAKAVAGLIAYAPDWFQPTGA